MAPSFDPAKDIPSLEGKIIIVTGGNTGLGKQTIAYLAAHGPARIYLAARTESKALAAISDIRASVPNAPPIEYLPLDLSSFASIEAAASAFKARESRLDLLVNNAGVMMTPYQLTKEGYELQLGTNHMGHMLFTKLLLPVLLATAEQQKKDTGNDKSDVRIVNVSSLGHSFAPPFSGIILDPTKWPGQWTGFHYGQSKLANILFARELAVRYPSITSVSVHPGIIWTDLWTAASEHWLMRWGVAIYAMMWRFLPGHFEDTKTGALSQTWAATVETRRLENGGYYVPVGKKGMTTPHARSKELAKKLWEWTEAQFERHGY
ncbi:oxidoreductase-like protein [Periconia macrospinosa]|uniref:Oxidoreductase-like protein n=1 Tax=Periconia macrospinosa TaxID=97972 RepID=A0A2V1E9U9_9PLEO|nr:oxidoreductase-like protein [Periconia macrospinosa]